MKLKKIFLVSALLIGSFLRLSQLGESPFGLNVDEVSIGYNAYSILKTAKDEYGQFLPLTFKSLGDYKPPIYIYLVTASEEIFGVTDFAVRFPSALFGILTILAIFYLVKEIFQDENVGYIASLLLAVSPWHIYYSRIASESLVSTFFISLGILLLLKINQNRLFGYLSALCLGLSLYIYHTPRIFVPIFITSYFLIYRKELGITKKSFIPFVTILLLFVILMTYSFIFGEDKTRAQMQFITNDIGFLRYILMDEGGRHDYKQLEILNEYFLLVFHMLRKFLAYLQSSFLFMNGLQMTVEKNMGLGVMYIFESLFLLRSFVEIIKGRFPNIKLVSLWIIIGLIPAAMTISEQHSIRTLVIIPALISISAFGFLQIFKDLQNLPKFLKYSSFLILSLLIGWNLLFAYLVFTTHFPLQRGEWFMEGSKETIDFIYNHQSEYQEIVFDPRRGTEGPFTVSVPHLYYLFYAKYDPHRYQQISKYSGDNLFKFDKFTIRSIDIKSDLKLNNTLLVASPWSLPPNEIPQSSIKKMIYLKNGKLALLVVSSDEK